MPPAASDLESSESTLPGTTSSISSSTVGGVPDFTDFKLVPFHLTPDGQPAPHRLREARRAFTLYLEPVPGSAIYQSLKSFQERSFTQHGPNQAHNTAPHVAILDHVYIERGSDFCTKWSIVNDFIDNVQSTLDDSTLEPPLFAGYDVLERPSRSLVMRLRVDPVFLSIARLIQASMGEHCSAIQISAMDRMDLAYNVLRAIPRETLKRLKELAKETIDVQDWVRSGSAWQLTLYEIMLESRVVGVQQQVKAIRTWPIQSQPKPFAFGLSPTLRVKFATWSTWLRHSTASVEPKRIEDKPTKEPATPCTI